MHFELEWTLEIASFDSEENKSYRLSQGSMEISIVDSTFVFNVITTQTFEDAVWSKGIISEEVLIFEPCTQ